MSEADRVRQNGAKDTPSVKPWFAVAGYIAGIVTLLFLMGLVVASLFNRTVPPGGRFAVVAVLALGAALSTAFIGGAAAGKGKIPIPFSKKYPFAFSVTGGIAVLVIILALGYLFYVHGGEDVFTATVRAHAVDVPVITEGKIRMEYGNSAATADIHSDGDAEFKPIPRQYFGQQVKVLPQVNGYKQEYQSVVLTDVPIDITLTEVSTRLTGQIVPPQKNRNAKVLAEGEQAAAVPDEYGRFEMIVHRKSPGDRIRLSVWINNRQVYDDYQVLPGPVTLSIKK